MGPPKQPGTCRVNGCLQTQYRPMNRVVVSQGIYALPWPFFWGDQAQCWSKWVWLAGHSHLLVVCSPWPFLGPALVGRLPLPSAAQLSSHSTRWYSCRQSCTHPFCFFVAASFVTATAYVLLKGKEEGRQEVMYMGMLKNLKIENLLHVKCLKALVFCWL